MVARGGRPRRHARRARQGARKGCAREHRARPQASAARASFITLSLLTPPPAMAADLLMPRYKLLAFVVLGENRLQASLRRACCRRTPTGGRALRLPPPTACLLCAPPTARGESRESV